MDRHELTITQDPHSKLHSGTCTCSWSSASYGLRLNVRAAHNAHLDSIGLSDPTIHENRVNEFLSQAVFGKRRP